MAIVKQSSGHKRSWFDRLAQLVCITAILTLTAAGTAGILGRRLEALLVTQQAAVKADQHQQDETRSDALQAAEYHWKKKQAGLEKALQSAKLKIKAAQSANTKIREQLVVLQKELAVLKKNDSVQVTEAVDSVKKAPQKAAAQATATKTNPPAPVGQQTAPVADGSAGHATSQAAASLPETVKPAGAASAAVTPSSGDMTNDVAAAESVSKASVSQASVPQASGTNQRSSTMTPPQSSLLAVPDADPVASE